MPKSYITVVILPKELVKQINSIGLSTINTRHAQVFCYILVNLVVTTKKEQLEYTPLGSKYLKKVFNSRYTNWLKPLISSNIIQSDGKWIQFLGKSIGYRINPEIITKWDDIETIKIPTKRNPQEDLTEEDLFYLNGVKSFCDSIGIDVEKLQEITAESIKGDDIETQFKRFTWIYKIKHLEMNILTAKRSGTNNRLNTNFTNLPNPLFKQIKESNDLMEIDAVNSQFSILANMIKDRVSDDFVQDAIQGRLYERVLEKLNCSRDEAKTAMLKYLYSDPKYKNKTKQLIEGLYPETATIIHEYKIKKNNSEFSIRMQKKEAEIYIDGALKKLYDMGILAISKHDSIIFHRKDLEVVEKVVREVVKERDFELTLKTS